jgi:hypothetical protein
MSLVLYYLDTTSGLMTTTAPTTTGKIVQLIGCAISPTKLRLAITPTVLL